MSSHYSRRMQQQTKLEQLERKEKADALSRTWHMSLSNHRKVKLSIPNDITPKEFELVKKWMEIQIVKQLSLFETKD